MLIATLECRIPLQRFLAFIFAVEIKCKYVYDLFNRWQRYNIYLNPPRILLYFFRITNYFYISVAEYFGF